MRPFTMSRSSGVQLLVPLAITASMRTRHCDWNFAWRMSKVKASIINHTNAKAPNKIR